VRQAREAMLTAEIKKKLWTMYGSRQHPAEWDGNVFGGGKISQRFWEYLMAVEMLDLTSDSVVLDIGGGKGFFAKLIAPLVQKVIILDEDQSADTARIPNIECIRQNATAETLPKVITKEVTHISCISVFEHVPEEIREQIVGAVDGHFVGKAFVTTFEFHPAIHYFEHQLTTRTMNRMVSGFSRFYPERMESSPLRCENAFGKATTPFNSRKKQYIGMWYPFAIKFSRMAG
jgi:2-polyprenyl-3-methyl-5-hydroxy-6-metoxy-1,4-benzoquinol methylase